MKLLSVLVVPVIVFAGVPVLSGEEPVTQRPDGFVSGQGRFVATVEFEEGNTEFVPLARFELRDEAGRLVYARSGDGHTVLDISDNGVVVGANFNGPVSGAARLVFYDPAGNPKGRAEVGFYNLRAFSADGSRFCVLDGRQGLRVFTAEGRELWNLGPGNRFAVSADGRLIALARDAEILLFSEGREAGRIPIGSPFVRQMVFSADGKRFAFIDRHRLRLLRVADAGVEFEFRPEEAGLDFISLDLSPDGGLVLAGLDYGRRGSPDRHRRGAAVLLDGAGQVVWEQALEYEDWNIGLPAVRFDSGQAFEVRTAGKVLRWQF
ncbi:MAG: hypothetical protein ABIK37_00265 [candidate division WOR-3 bacterium]